MRPISRRSTLQLGGLGLAGVVVGGSGLLWTRETRFTPDTDEELRQPELLRSTDGDLRVRLEASEGPVGIGGRKATALSYNGSLPGPTLHLQPGDRLRVQLVNRLDAPTNLHVHGLYVSPEGNGDNVFVTVDPGDSFDYEYRLPDDHPPGVFWYHPHLHGTVADQVFGGLYGTIVVGESEPPPVSRDRVLVVADIGLDGSGRLRTPSAMDRMMGREGDLVLVNGQHRPLLAARPGERERWRIVNACTSRYLRLRLDGQQLQLLGIDSGRYPEPHAVDELVLVPGNRADVLVTAAEGSSSLRALPYDRGGMSAMMGGRSTSAGGEPLTLATFEVSGAAVPALPPVPVPPAARDLRGTEPNGRRRLTFDMGMSGGGMDMSGGGMAFTIDGAAFDPARIDQPVQAGAVEEWTLTNRSPMDHPLHLHVWPMQVVAESGRPVDDVVWRDTVDVPAGGEVTVRIAFDSFSGRTVYHCHILDHEDAGMMGIVEVS